MLYIGSCRYMYNYEWDFFPGRLHSTKEIIFFLENIDNIEDIIKNNNKNLSNIIFGDINHPEVIGYATLFINNNNNNKNNNKIIIEICSRKVMYYNNIPVSDYYAKQYNLQNSYNLTEKILSDEEINEDLDIIMLLCKTIFSQNVEIHIIPHLNLKTLHDNMYISSRNSFVQLLKQLCEQKKIYFHDIGMQCEKNGIYYIEKCMSDSTHYDNISDYNIVKNYLIGNIYS